ncbi:MAG TPA: DUF4412 domain-containing protein [Myxococcaceae bacterium]|nr:DUF4412 domain-containing protein [Myxococcaceae bacterium]
MTRALVAALCLAAVPALAYEGVIETKMTATGNAGGQAMSTTGNGKIYLKGMNSRMEQEMKLPGVPDAMKQVVIHRGDEPDTTYMVHDANRTYQKLANEKDDASSAESAKWTVKKLGKETVAGRSTEHVQVSRDGKEPMELWVDTKLVSAGDLERAFASADQRGGGWWKALKEAGVAGIPLKVVTKNERGGGGMTWEATSVKAQSVPDSAFKVPAGYTESRSGSAGATPPQHNQQMRDQMMQRLTPEQRKQVEEMMKQHQGGGNQ